MYFIVVIYAISFIVIHVRLEDGLMRVGSGRLRSYVRYFDVRGWWDGSGLSVFIFLRLISLQYGLFFDEMLWRKGIVRVRPWFRLVYSFKWQVIIWVFWRHSLYLECILRIDVISLKKGSEVMVLSRWGVRIKIDLFSSLLLLIVIEYN